MVWLPYCRGVSKKGRCTRHRGARARVTNLSSRLPLRTVAASNAYSYHQLVRSSLTLCSLNFLVLFVNHETLVFVCYATIGSLRTRRNGCFSRPIHMEALSLFTINVLVMKTIQHEHIRLTHRVTCDSGVTGNS